MVSWGKLNRALPAEEHRLISLTVLDQLTLPKVGFASLFFGRLLIQRRYYLERRTSAYGLGQRVFPRSLGLKADRYLL